MHAFALMCLTQILCVKFLGHSHGQAVVCTGGTLNDARHHQVVELFLHLFSIFERHAIVGSMYGNLSGKMNSDIITVRSINICGGMRKNISIFHQECVKLVEDLEGCGHTNMIDSLGKISSYVGCDFGLSSGNH